MGAMNGAILRFNEHTLADQITDFFLHQQIHQLQTGLMHQFTHPPSQPWAASSAPPDFRGLSGA
jgi:hypothetical protein